MLLGVLPIDFHLTPGVAKLDDLHNHSAPLIVVNTSDETFQLPFKVTVPQLDVLNGENINIVDISDIIQTKPNKDHRTMCLDQLEDSFDPGYSKDAHVNENMEVSREKTLAPASSQPNLQQFFLYL